MPKGALRAKSGRNIDGIGEGSLVGTLSRLLQLTSEAVLVFDGRGRVLLANDEAMGLLGGELGVVGRDVRDFFPATKGERVTDEDFSVADLPFPVDGTSEAVPVRTEKSTVLARVRCDSVQAPGETYLLVAAPVDDADLAIREYDRDLAELKRANKRLSGALSIVLDTLDSEDVSTLFDRVLEETTETMEADGTIVYLAEQDGFHLRGISNSLVGDKICRFMSFDRGMERLLFREGRAVRLRVSQPSGEELRQGRLAARQLVNEETREVVRIEPKMLPPFTSFIAVPVWFGGHIISVIEVGWRRMRPLAKDDAQLLDSVAHYLAVQLAGAFTAIRSRRADRLDGLLNDLREELLSTEVSDLEDEQALSQLMEVFREAADELECSVSNVRDGAVQGLAMVDLPLNGLTELDLGDLASADGALGGAGASASVVPVPPGSAVASRLRELGEPCIGALLDFGELLGERRRALLLRPDGAEPFDDLELDFLARLAEELREGAVGAEVRSQDKRISQALQNGMRNELQQVPGISAQGVYSSATASASVGGDFYDLIRLPDRKACVIMGDVSGKGIEAASVSAAVKTALGAYSWEGMSPARMVRNLNEFLLGFSRVETFATLFVGVVDLNASKITYCSAGHPPAILMAPNASKISILDVQSGVVGAFHDIAYTNGTARLHKGDVLLLYTDGTTEARSPSGAFFGEQGLRDMVMRESDGEKPFEGFCERLLDTLDAFTGRNLKDDVAMVALRFDELGKAK